MNDQVATQAKPSLVNATLAIHGGEKFRKTPMPSRIALGEQELKMIEQCIAYYRERNLDPCYDGPFEKMYTDAFVEMMGGGYADGVATGTSALYIAVAAMELPKGSEVIVSPIKKGFTPATIVDDAPITFTAAQTGSQAWEPKNYDGTFDGPIPLRTALARSKNLVSIRILQSIGAPYAQDYISRFGFDPKLHPPYLTMALGAGNVTPMQMLAGYSIFANGGYRVTPYFIARVEDSKGNVLFAAKPARAGAGAERAIDERNAYVMTSLMRDVVRGGTAGSAMRLGRGDLAGKTGTTNDFLDAWFGGYNASLVGVAWVGFDQPKTLGRNETGGNVALPIWINYMAIALKGVPEKPFNAPQGVVSANGDVFYQEFAPRSGEHGGEASAIPEAARNELF